METTVPDSCQEPNRKGVPDSCQEPNRKGGDTAKVIIIPTETANIDIRKHFTHEVIQNGQMLLVKVPTSAQMADILTKGLHLPQVLACVDGLLQRSTTRT